MLKNNFSGFQLEAGTDEAGRGCLSGPVVAAAVILPANFNITNTCSDKFIFFDKYFR